jgi:hypothetical protein
VPGDWPHRQHVGHNSGVNTLRVEPRSLRLILLTGATVFGVSAIALLLTPAAFLTLLGLADTPDLEWSMRMIAITLVALTGNMATVAVFAKARGVVFASAVMLLAAGSLGVITLLIPADPTWFTIAYALVGFGFSASYLVGLAVWLKRDR